MSEGSAISTLQQSSNALTKRAEMATTSDADGRAMPRIPEELSILPLRGFVMFPGSVLPLTVSRPASIKLLDETLPLTKVVGFLTQRQEEKEEPAPQDLYHVGTAAIVLKLLRQAENNIVIVVQGLRRFAMRKIVATQPYLLSLIHISEPTRP